MLPVEDSSLKRASLLSSSTYILFFCLGYFGIIRVLFLHVPPSYETFKGAFRSHPWHALSLSSSNVSTFSLEHDTSNTDFNFTQGTR
jgi:hypothetical protein